VKPAALATVRLDVDTPPGVLVTVFETVVTVLDPVPTGCGAGRPNERS
jgi:hypothetical protein